MKPQSAKKKGYRFEKCVLDAIRNLIDSTAYYTRGSGSGAEKGDIISPHLNAIIECKNQRKLKIVEWWEKLKTQTFNEIPILIVRNTKHAECKEPLVITTIEHLAELLDKNTNKKPELTYRQEQLIDSLIRDIKSWTRDRTEFNAKKVELSAKKLKKEFGL